MNMHLKIFIQNRITHCYTQVLLPDCWPVTGWFFAGCYQFIVIQF